MSPDTRSFLEWNYRSIMPPHGPTLWEIEAQEVLLYYARLAWHLARSAEGNS